MYILQVMYLLSYIPHRLIVRELVLPEEMGTLAPRYFRVQLGRICFHLRELQVPPTLISSLIS